MKVGRYEAEAVVIKGGLEPGERMVVDGGKLLSSGQPVTVERGPVMRKTHHYCRPDPGFRAHHGRLQARRRPCRDPIRPVLSAVVQNPPRASGTSAAGIVEPRFKSDLGFRVVGRLISRPVNVGDFVAEGQTLATLDATALELAVRSARAEGSEDPGPARIRERGRGAKAAD